MTEKRFFEFSDDADCVRVLVVAVDAAAATSLLVENGWEWGYPSSPSNQPAARELSLERAGLVIVRNDAGERVQLAACSLGDAYSTET